MTGWSLSGRARVIADDDVNTDQILPRRAFELPASEQGAFVLESIRPGWSATVRPGDILVAGRRFGCGSGRPAPLVIAQTGIAAVVAESLGDLFLRNAVAYAVPVLECPGILAAVHEGDSVELDISTGEVRVGDHVLYGAPLPAALLETITAGGIHAQLRRAGYLA